MAAIPLLWGCSLAPSSGPETQTDMSKEATSKFPYLHLVKPKMGNGKSPDGKTPPASDETATVAYDPITDARPLINSTCQPSDVSAAVVTLRSDGDLQIDKEGVDVEHLAELIDPSRLGPDFDVDELTKLPPVTSDVLLCLPRHGNKLIGSIREGGKDWPISVSESNVGSSDQSGAYKVQIAVRREISYGEVGALVPPQVLKLGILDRMLKPNWKYSKFTRYTGEFRAEPEALAHGTLNLQISSHGAEHDPLKYIMERPENTAGKATLATNALYQLSEEVVAPATASPPAPAPKKSASVGKAPPQGTSPASSPMRPAGRRHTPAPAVVKTKETPNYPVVTAAPVPASCKLADPDDPTTNDACYAAQPTSWGRLKGSCPEGDPLLLAPHFGWTEFDGNSASKQVSAKVAAADSTKSRILDGDTFDRGSAYTLAICGGFKTGESTRWGALCLENWRICLEDSEDGIWYPFSRVAAVSGANGIKLRAEIWKRMPHDRLAPNPKKYFEKHLDEKKGSYRNVVTIEGVLVREERGISTCPAPLDEPPFDRSSALFEVSFRGRIKNYYPGEPYLGFVDVFSRNSPEEYEKVESALERLRRQTDAKAVKASRAIARFIQPQAGCLAIPDIDQGGLIAQTH